MALVIKRGDDPRPVSGYVADRRLYLNADRSRIVEEGDPQAAYLLCSKGKVVPANEALRLGLIYPESPKPEVLPEPVEIGDLPPRVEVRRRKRADA